MTSERKMMLGHMSLSGRGRQIVDHVGRYRMTTNAVVHRQFLAGRRANAVTKVTLRLCEGDYLRSFPLYHPKRYFTLGLRGATLLGLPPNRTLPLGPQTLPTEYGILAFALLGQARHERLTSSEFIARYPGTPQHVAEQCYCVDASRQTLELVRVDLGGKPDHVARKCRADIVARANTEPFVSLLEQGRFRLVVVTCTSEKAAAIRDAFDSRLWPERLSIHLAVVSDLLPLIASLNHAS